jgi:hypothetical protein
MYHNKQVSTISSTRFLGIYINDTINWKYHIEYILPKLSATSYAMRIIKPYMSIEMLKKVFIHLVVCLMTGPKPLPKRALHIVFSIYVIPYILYRHIPRMRR